MKTNEVWVYAEQHGGEIAEVSLELLGKGAELARALGVKLAAVVLGDKVKGLAPTFVRYGADKVYAAEAAALRDYRSLPYSRAAAALIKEHEPQVVLFGATTTGRDIAPRIASELKVGLTADCTNLKIGDYAKKDAVYKDILYQIRPAFGGNIIATIVCPDHRPQMATVREGVMKMSVPDDSRSGEIVVSAPEIGSELQVAEVVERIKQDKTVDLKGARIIVSGGMGLGSKENFALVHQLAHVLGGTVAGSRAAVDAGFIPKDHQVGQTGTTVRPTLYVAVGISGQIQHLAGMSESNRIVAINSDPAAPIFNAAHYGIVGDLNEVIPRFIEAYKSARK
jgi:electron transfer flavoprotein alpha subunit